MNLLTIVTEGLLKDQIISLLKAEGCSGFTVTRAEGEGSRGINASDWEGPNQRIETVVPQERAEAILAVLAETFFDDYAVVAWLSEVKVIRSKKFDP